MKDALLKHGWWQEYDFINNLDFYHKVVSNHKFWVGLKYNIKTKQLSVTIRSRVSNISQTIYFTPEFIRDCYSGTLNTLKEQIRVLPLIKYDEFKKVYYCD